MVAIPVIFADAFYPAICGVEIFFKKVLSLGGRVHYYPLCKSQILNSL